MSAQSPFLWAIAQRALALEQTPPDIATARQGLLKGGNNADDIDGMIWLFRYYRDLPALQKAINHWRATDPLLTDLTNLANAIDTENANGPAAPEITDEHRAELNRLNARLAPEAMAFSASLGDGSRQIKIVLTIVNLFTVGLLVLVQYLYVRHFLAQRQKDEDALKSKKRACTSHAGLDRRRSHQHGCSWLCGLYEPGGGDFGVTPDDRFERPAPYIIVQDC